MLVNYFKLEDPMQELYDSNGEKIKSELVKKYMQEKN